MTLVTLILAAAIGLVPVPAEYTPNTCHTSFKKAVAELQPWQKKEAYRLTIQGKKVKIEALTDEGRFRAKMSLEQLRALGELPQNLFVLFNKVCTAQVAEILPLAAIRQITWETHGFLFVIHLQK